MKLRRGPPFGDDPGTGLALDLILDHLRDQRIAEHLSDDQVVLDALRDFAVQPRRSGVVPLTPWIVGADIVPVAVDADADWALQPVSPTSLDDRAAGTPLSRIGRFYGSPSAVDEWDRSLERTSMRMRPAQFSPRPLGPIPQNASRGESSTISASSVRSRSL